MFEFRYVELMNWAYWPTMRLPLDQRTIMISGPNGSGKTTFLDALRTLLRAPRLSAGRRFTDYLVGRVDTAVIKAVVTNDLYQRDSQPFEFKGFTKDQVTLAVILKRRSGRWEKRFTIQDGDLDLEQLRQLKSHEFLGPATYTREIQQAGFSEAFLKVLALEQGQTDKLCEKSPRELLDLLLDVHGDKQIIERYKQARENYQEANLEVTQLGARLAEEQAKLLSTQKAAEEYKRYHQLINERNHYENVLIPQAEYKQGKAEIQQAELTINDLNLRLGPLDRDIVEVENKINNAQNELDSRKQKVMEARDKKEAMEKEERALDLTLNTLLNERKQLDELLATVEDAEVEPIGPLREQLEAARHEAVRIDLRIEEEKKRLRDIRQEIESLDWEQHKIYPRFVNEFCRVLEENSIQYSLLCDLVEITDTKWQLAIESMLGRDRFSVLVAKADQKRTRELAERNRYRCYVVERELSTPRRKAEPGAAIEYVQFLEDGIPVWVVENLSRTILVDSVQDGLRLGSSKTSVTSQGYRQDRRGGISIATEQFYCGSLGQTAQQDDLREAGKRIQSNISMLDGQLSEAKAKQHDLERRLAIQENLGRASEARRRRQEIDEEVSKANEEHHTALEVRRQAEHKLFDAVDELNNFERETREYREFLLTRRGDQSEFLDEIRDQQKRITQLKDQLSTLSTKLGDKNLTDRALREVPELDEITPKYYAVRNLLEQYSEPPEEGAVEVYEHHKAQYERQRKIYREHEEGLKSWETEFRLAKEKYLVVVDHTIREYRKNVLALANLAGVTAEVVLPNLHETDESLDKAELQVRIGFDGKRATAISGAFHSGGQRVVSSLILLMSLATSGGISRGGFFIIDEPFAHLSLERIDDVTRFLDKTQCQFILTSPTTHNVNVFSAARLQLNFRVKAPTARRAPIPTIIRR